MIARYNENQSLLRTHPSIFIFTMRRAFSIYVSLLFYTWCKPGIGYIREAVPGAREELTDREERTKQNAMPCDRGYKSQDDEQNHHRRSDDARGLSKEKEKRKPNNQWERV